MADSCISCELIRRRDSGDAPLWDCIYRTQYWDVVHGNSTSLLGWLILIPRRHMVAIDEMTEDEAVELGKLIRQVSIILKDVTGCTKTYVAQFSEAAGYQHTHFHIMPRMVDQPEEDKGLGIFRHLGLSAADRVSENQMDQLAANIQRRISKLD